MLTDAEPLRILSDQEIATILRHSVKHGYYDDLFWHGDAGPFFKSSNQDTPIYASVNCNDLFYWGCAEAETVWPEDLPDIERAIADAKACDDPSDHGEIFGTSLWCCRKRATRPQKPCMKDYKPELLQLFLACGPERNG